MEVAATSLGQLGYNGLGAAWLPWLEKHGCLGWRSMVALAGEAWLPWNGQSTLPAREMALCQLERGMALCQLERGMALCQLERGMAFGGRPSLRFSDLLEKYGPDTFFFT